MEISYKRLYCVEVLTKMFTLYSNLMETKKQVHKIYPENRDA